MTRRQLRGEQWLPVTGWQYDVSSHGHIRRRRGKRRVDARLDCDGYTSVVLVRGRHSATVFLDTLVDATFNGYIPDGRPIHLDGLPWNNWPSNLGKGVYMAFGNSNNLTTQWTVWHAGKLQHGPFTDHQAARSAARLAGDVIIGRNPARQVIAYEVVCWQGQTPRNPYDMVRYYQAQAALHQNQFWSGMLSEASAIITTLANECLAARGVDVSTTLTDNEQITEQLIDEDKPAEVEVPQFLHRAKVTPVSRRRPLTPPTNAPRRRVPLE